MQIRHLRVENFRGTAALEWTPGASFCCLIGPGDAGKSTVLDAIEAALSSRWLLFGEHDFHCADTSKTILVEVTVGELSKALKSDDRFGLYIRGWTQAGELRDEPEQDDEPVLTVRLTVDATLEPVWQVVCERADEPRTISNRRSSDKKQGCPKSVGKFRTFSRSTRLCVRDPRALRGGARPLLALRGVHAEKGDGEGPRARPRTYVNGGQDPRLFGGDATFLATGGEVPVLSERW